MGETIRRIMRHITGRPGREAVQPAAGKEELAGKIPGQLASRVDRVAEPCQEGVGGSPAGGDGGRLVFTYDLEEMRSILASVVQGSLVRRDQEELMAFLGIDWEGIYASMPGPRAFRRVKGEANIRLHNLRRKGIV